MIQPWGNQGLFVLASGSVPPNPAELLGSQRMRDVLAEVGTRYDRVVVDSPPILPVTDAIVLSREVDGVNPGAGRARMALVAPLAECIEAAERIARFIRSA